MSRYLDVGHQKRTKVNNNTWRKDVRNEHVEPGSWWWPFDVIIEDEAEPGGRPVLNKYEDLPVGGTGAGACRAGTGPATRPQGSRADGSTCT
jgi:hypothetical protein